MRVYHNSPQCYNTNSLQCCNVSNAQNYNVTNRVTPKLSRVVISTWRWLWRWQNQARKAGNRLYPSTRYLAKNQGVTERTMYRRLAALKEAGALASEVVEGVVRFLQVLGPPPEPKLSRSKSSGVMGRRASEVEAKKCQGSLPYRETQSTGVTQEVQQQIRKPEHDPAVVEILEKGAGLPEPDALAIAAEVRREGWSVERVKAAISAYREAKGVRTPGGWLRAAIRAGIGPCGPLPAQDKPERPQRDRSQSKRAPTAGEIERYRAMAVEILNRRGEAVTDESRREVARSIWRRDVVLGYV